MRKLFLLLSCIAIVGLSIQTADAGPRQRYVPFLGHMVPVSVLETRVYANDVSFRDYGAPAARRDFGLSGAGVEVCVIDTGVDASHEQLDNGKVVAFKDFVNSRTKPYDDYGHGTHVASIIAGDGKGGSLAAKYRGVAPAASISAAKVLNSRGSGSLAQVIDGIEWCASRPSVDVINMSLGSQDVSPELDQAANLAVAMGKTVVVSAGNHGPSFDTVGSPGNAGNVVTVGAASGWSKRTGNGDYPQFGPYLAPWSSRGAAVDKPDVVGPGVRVTAAGVALFASPSGYTALSGTSMSSPFVAGIAALMLQADPRLSPQAVKDDLRASALDLGAPGPDQSWGAGLVNGYSAVAAAKGMPGKDIFPPHVTIPASLMSNNDTWVTAIQPDSLAPIAATILVDGVQTSVALRATIDTDHTKVVDVSLCPNDFPCGFGALAQEQVLTYKPVLPGPSCVGLGPGGPPYSMMFWRDENYSPPGSTSSFTIDLFNAHLIYACPR